MPVRIDLRGAGAEAYLPYAKRKLAQLKEKLARSGRKWLSQSTILDDNKTRLFIQAGHIDVIRITGSGLEFPQLWLDTPQTSEGIRARQNLWVIFPFRRVSAADPTLGFAEDCYLSNFRINTAPEGVAPNVTRVGDLPNIGDHLVYDKIVYDGPRAYGYDAFCLGPEAPGGGPPEGLLDGNWVPDQEQTDYLFDAFDALYQHNLDDLTGFRGQRKWWYYLFDHINYLQPIFQWWLLDQIITVDDLWINGEIVLKIPQGAELSCLESNVYVYLADALCFVEPVTAVVEGVTQTVDYRLLLNLTTIVAGARSGLVSGSDVLFGPSCQNAGQHIYAIVTLRDLLTAPISKCDHPDLIEDPMRDLTGRVTVTDGRGAIAAHLGIPASRVVGGDFTWDHSFFRVLEGGWVTHGYTNQVGNSGCIFIPSAANYDTPTNTNPIADTEGGLPATVLGVTNTIIGDQEIEVAYYDPDKLSKFNAGAAVRFVTGPNAGQTRLLKSASRRGPRVFFTIDDDNRFVPDPPFGAQFETIYTEPGKLDHWRELLYTRSLGDLLPGDFEIWNHEAQFHSHRLMLRTLKDGLFSAHAVTQTFSATVKPQSSRAGTCATPFDFETEGIYSYTDSGNAVQQATARYVCAHLVNGQLQQSIHLSDVCSFNDVTCWEFESDIINHPEGEFDFWAQRRVQLPSCTMTSYYLNEEARLAPAFSLSLPGKTFSEEGGDRQWDFGPRCSVYTPGQDGDFNPNLYVSRLVSWFPHLEFAQWSDSNYYHRWPMNALEFSNNNRIDVIAPAKFAQTFGPDGFGNVYVNGQLLYVSPDKTFPGGTVTQQFSNTFLAGSTHFGANINWSIAARYIVDFDYPGFPEVYFETKTKADVSLGRTYYPPPDDWKGHLQMLFRSGPRMLPRSFSDFAPAPVFRFIVWPDAVDNQWGFCVFAYEDQAAAELAWLDWINLMRSTSSTNQEVADAVQALRALRTVIANNFATDELMDIVDPRTFGDARNQTLWINTIWQP